jgi:hypothetical protein
VNGFVLPIHDHGAAVERHVDFCLIRRKAPRFPLDIDVKHRLQVGRGEIPEFLRESRIDNEGRVGDRVGKESLPFPARYRAGAAVQHLHGLHDFAAVGAGAQAYIAIAQLPIVGVEIDAVKRLAASRSNLTPPPRTSDLGHPVRFGAKFHFDFLVRRHLVCFSGARAPANLWYDSFESADCTYI